MKISCPYCDSPVTMKGDSSWECGWCGNFGPFRELNAWDKAKLLQEEQVPKRISIPVRLVFETEEKPTRKFSRAELEDMVRRWDFSENEWACRDLLVAAFPEEVRRWPPEELSKMGVMDLLAETGEHDPETAIQMMKLLLDTAEGHLQDPEAAYFLLGNELYDFCRSECIHPRLLDHLKTDDRLARQLFQSAYVGSPQEDILLSCSQMGEKDLRQKLLDLLSCNPFPHDEIELETDE